MKVVMITPFYHQQRGNTVTVQRISRSLNRLGILTEVVSLTNEKPFPALPQGSIVHGFNAYHFYNYWKQHGSPSIPYVVTTTGTDLNHHLFQKNTRDAVIGSLTGAQAVHVFNDEARKMIWREVPWVKEKTRLIPQGVIEFPSLKGALKQEEGTFLFVLPAGIRKVKNITSAISMLSCLHKYDSRVRLILVGPVLEEEEGAKIQRLIEQNSHWIKYLGEVPHQEMGEIYRYADVVLNSSFSEGQSTAILEGMAQGIPVLVSDVTGNRSMVDHGENGFLYNDEQDFVHYARLLMKDEELRRTLGVAGKEYVECYHSMDKEVDDLLSVYQEVLKHEEKYPANIAWRRLG